MTEGKRHTYVVELKLKRIKGEELEAKRKRAKALYDEFLAAMQAIKGKDPQITISPWREKGFIPLVPITVVASLRKEIAALSMVKSVEYLGAPISRTA